MFDKHPVDRVILIVLDSLGIGELTDAADYGDTGSNTLGNTARAVGELSLPNLGALGIGNLTEIPGTPPETPSGACARMAFLSPGKDSTTGHWEICGCILDKPFPTYPDGFPPRVMRAFEDGIRRGALGNRPASGTQIIQELGEEHVRTGQPIVYTSADSVFQIAAHEEVVPLQTLYHWCQVAREVLAGDDRVARVIARPFVGCPGSFVRTANRKDFSLPPVSPTLLDYASAEGVLVTGVGKIHDIFAGRGIGRSIHTDNNAGGIREVIALIEGGTCPPHGNERRETSQSSRELVMVNLVDFDMVYGHRNDPAGYARALQEFDEALPRMVGSLRSRDLLVITADHGCDPTTESTDHSREYVPVLLAGNAVMPGVILADRATAADLGATVAEALGIRYGGAGTSFLQGVFRN